MVATTISTKTTTTTHCPYCALQCGMRLTVDGGPEAAPAVTVAGWEEFPVSRGTLCQKGWTAGELLDHPERLTVPLARDGRGGELRPVSWEEALDRAAAGLLACGERYGPAALGVFGGGGLTNEKAYLLGKFARVALRTPNIDYNGRFCMSAAATAQQAAFGVDRGLPFPLADVAAAEAVLLVGSNPADVMPPFMGHLEEQAAAGGVLVVADPRRTPTARQATLHLQLTPGTDLLLANGLLHLALKEGLVDERYVAAHTTGFDAVRRMVAADWPDRVERVTGVPVAQLRRAVHLLAGAGSAMVLTARGAEQHASGADTVLAFINLTLALGLVGRPASGFATLTGQANGQGGREHGQKADQLPGYRSITNPEHRAHVAAVWGVDPGELPGPGRSAYELLDTMGTDGGVRALLLMGSDVAVSAPRAGHVTERLGALDFLVVADFFLSESARHADVVLPSAQWAEEDGTVTNLEGRVLRRRAALPPPPGARTDLEILSGLAVRLGRGKGFTADPRAVFAELRRASAGGVADYSGITWERLEAGNGVYWPCPSEDHPGTPRLFNAESGRSENGLPEQGLSEQGISEQGLSENGPRPAEQSSRGLRVGMFPSPDGMFPTPDGRSRFHPVRHRSAAEEPDAEFPLYLTTGRSRAHYQSGNQTRRVAALRDAEPRAYVEMHPAQAAALGITDGAPVRLTTRRGQAVATARVTASIRPDTLFVPFHWAGDGRVNLLTNPALDPRSGMPELKLCAARAEPAGDTAPPPPQAPPPPA